MAQKLSDEELNNVTGGCGGSKKYRYHIEGPGGRNAPKDETGWYGSLDDAKPERDEKVAKMFATYPAFHKIWVYGQSNKTAFISETSEIIER